MSDPYNLAEYAAQKQAQREREALLPPEFWASRPHLTRIRDAARARLIAPEVALGCVLAYISTMGHARMGGDMLPLIPGIVARPSPISLFVTLLGPSGAGKTGGLQIARELFPQAPEWALLGRRPGTGEALPDMYWKVHEDVDERGKKTMEHVRGKRSWLMTFDEGALLEGLSSRAGNTLVAELHTAWSCEGIGTETSSDLRTGRTRHLEQFTYRTSMIMNLQPATAQTVIRQDGSGWPQRFLWFPTHDPDASATKANSDPLQPLGWQPPTIPPTSTSGGGNFFLTLDPEVVTEITQQRAAVVSRTLELDPLDGQRTLNRLRVAGCLAMLDGRVHINTDDWELAGQVMTMSDQARGYAIKHSKEAARAEKEATRKEAVLTDLQKEAGREERIIANGMKSAHRILTERGPLTQSKLSKALSVPQRDHFPEILRRLETQGQVTVTDDGKVQIP